MTRSLYVLRHGKSDWGAPSGSDHQRPLKKRGRKAARLVGQLLSRLDQMPDLVLTSSAERAQRTAELAHEAGAWTCPLEVTDDLYGCGPRGIVERARAVAPEVERLLVVGHQPTLSELVAALTGGAPPAMPTGALARIDFELDGWEELDAGRGALVWLVPPRLVEGFQG